MKRFHLILVLATVIEIQAEKVSFVGSKLYKVVPKNADEVTILENIKNAGIGDVWNEYFKVNDDVRVLVSAEMQPVFLGQLKRANIGVKTIIEDVQKAIDDSMVRNTQRSTSFLSYDWENYHDLAAVENWMEELAQEYPNIVSLVSMETRSVENREIKGIVINYNPSRQKPLAFLEGTIHAREWISTAVVTWMVKEFLTSSDPDVRYMAENLEWHVFPVVNPDGYVYTFTTHRMWRKNRSRTNFTSCGANDDMSNGVDLNRNFDFFWMTIGASNDPCSNTFAGPAVASEPETRAISDYVLGLREKGDIVYFLSFHSYTQLMILPYSHVQSHTDYPADNHDHLVEIATNGATKAAERFGTNYRVGIAAEVLYTLSGSSFDWAKYHANASISYLIELRDMGEYGFLLPASQIVPNSEEIMDAVIEMDRTARRLGYYSGSASLVVSFTLMLVGLIYVNLVN